MWNKYLIVIIAVLAVAAALLMKPFSTKHDASNTLTIGLQSGYPPFEYMDKKGQIVGFDVDLAQLIADKLGKKLVIKDMEFEGEILSLKQGKIDLIISGMDITPSRQKEIRMIPYHGQTAKSLNLLFWGKIPPDLQTLQDFEKQPKATVSVESGSTSESILNHFYPKVNAKSFQGSLAPIMDVKFGKSAANLVQPDVATYLIKQHPEIVSISVPLPEEAQIFGAGIGVKKENEELYLQVEKVVEELKTSGELEKLEKKWFQGVN